MTPAQVIERYLELRSTKSALVAEHKLEVAQYDDALVAMENYLLATMNERGEKQIKTDAGTAFKSPQARVKLVDREAVIRFATTWENGMDIFTNAVSKDFILKFEEEHPGAVVPGVEVTRTVEVNVRKA